MKKISLFFIVTLLLSLVLTACFDGDKVSLGEPDYKGYVMDKKEGSILVVGTEPKDYSKNGGDPEYYSALWGSNAPDRIEVGQQVEVWVDGGVQESYPGQAKIGDVRVVSQEIEENADLSEAEALRKALNKINSVEGIPVVKSIKFSEKTNSWAIEIQVENAGEKSILTMSINDN
ncbi:YobA family protein [Pontibacillus yanchengensis]|nr:YobA family protein [Pontibacillus yanchengensis]